MSKILENKHTIHIVSEIIALCSVTMYFSSKNKKLSNQIDDLTKHINELDDVINKHEQIIKKLAENLTKLTIQNTSRTDMGQSISPPPKNLKSQSKPTSRKSEKSENVKKQMHTSLYPPVKQHQTKITIAPPPPPKKEEESEEEEVEEEDTDELDAEIEEELRDLDEEEEIEEIDVSRSRRNNNIVVMEYVMN